MGSELYVADVSIESVANHSCRVHINVSGGLAYFGDIGVLKHNLPDFKRACPA